MEHYHDVIAFLGFFVVAFLFMFICGKVRNIIKSRKTLQYGNAKVGDYLKPRSKK